MKRFINGSLIKMCTLIEKNKYYVTCFFSSSLEHFKVTDYSVIVKKFELNQLLPFHVSLSYCRPAYPLS